MMLVKQNEIVGLCLFALVPRLIIGVLSVHFVRSSPFQLPGRTDFSKTSSSQVRFIYS